MKYIFGYSSFFYDRNTDVDLTSSEVFDNQFYVSQEAEYVSHELQAFIDVNDQFSLTSGLFYYDSKITQRGDFYDSLCTLNQPCDVSLCQPGVRYRGESDSVRRDQSGVGVPGRPAADADSSLRSSSARSR